MRVAVDCDGVIFDCVAGIVEIINDLYHGRCATDFQPNSWGFEELNFTPEEWDSVWVEVQSRRDFWLHLRPYKENLSALDEFISTHQDAELFFVTSRIPTNGLSVSKQTERALLQSGIAPSSLLTSSWSVIPVERPDYKHKVMKHLGIEFSIDDRGPTVEECSKVDGHRAFLLTRPWNSDTVGVERVNNMAEFLERIK